MMVSACSTARSRIASRRASTDASRRISLIRSFRRIADGMTSPRDRPSCR
ncbi:Uncharacterised protein [Bordetella pertussis]|nr:Uncharacterised protein [Bordetella pertussis]CFP63757.1 Uncharacterised protein [Bordetella pertussis]